MNLTFKMIAILAIMISTIYACSDKEVLSELDHENLIASNKSFNSQDSAFSYADKYLTYYAKGIAVLAEDSTFRDIVHNEVDKKFDGDYNVLIESLEDACADNNYPFRSLMDTIFSVNGMGVTMNDMDDAFVNIDSHNYYPQLYIPEFSAFKNTSADTIFTVAFNADESQLSLAGYIESGTNSFSNPRDINASEIGTPEVWVISLNENVNDVGTVGEPDTVTSSGKGGHTCTCTNNSPISPRMYDMTIKKHNESFWNGDSDIAIRSKYSYYNCLENGSYIEFPLYSYLSFRGTRVRDFTRDEVDNQTTVNVDFPYFNDWHVECYEKDKIATWYVIFERDAWPASIEVDPLECPRNSSLDMVIKYRSSDDSFQSGWIYGNDCQSQTDAYYVENYSRSNSDFDFDVDL